MDLVERAADQRERGARPDAAAAPVGRTLSIGAEAMDRIARLSAAVGCTPEQTVEDALLALEQLHEDQRQEPHAWTEEDDADMRRAIAEFEMGEAVAHEQVMAEARAIVGA